MTDRSTREVAKTLVRQAAWDEGKECEHCQGAGRVSGGRKVIHSMLGPFGADHDVEAAESAIDRAEDVRWIESILGHDLAVTVEGKTYYYDVKRPAEAEEAKVPDDE